MASSRMMLVVSLTLLLATVAAYGGGSGGSSSSSAGGLKGSRSLKSTARFSFPYDVAVDGDDNLWVADSGNSEIREITTAGAVTTFDGVSSGLEDPVSVTVSGFDDLYISNSNEILLIMPNRVVSTDAGSDDPGSGNGTGSGASFDAPADTVLDSAGNLYVADFGNNEIRKITPSEVVTTFAGSTTPVSANGTGTAASFHGPYGIAIDEADNLYVTDYYNEEIREITPGAVVSTFAGSTTPGSHDGDGTNASFRLPAGIAIDSTSGNLYVADRGNNEIRQIKPDGKVETVAGSTTPGNKDGTALPR